MEIRRKRAGGMLLLCICIIHAMLAHAQIKSQPPPPPPQKVYNIKDGNMHIELSKHLSMASLDTFINRYALTDLKINDFIKTNSFEHLQNLGWTLDYNDASRFAISKPLRSSNAIGDYAKKIVVTEKSETAGRFPVESENVMYGFNKFIHKNPFSVNGDDVTFFLRGFTKSNKVFLAGSFNDWNPEALAMKRTDSGWIAHVTLRPGKYWYKFIADGNWMLDNDNLQREDDGYGNTNSVYFQGNVVFRIEGYKTAKKAFVAGSFNSWAENQLPMQRMAYGWRLPVYLAEGTHTYKFLVDGKWITDDQNPNKLPDGIHGYNSVIPLGQPYVFKLKGYTNAKQVLVSGTFNGWRQDELYMKNTATGWELPYILRPGNYQYKFLVDGQWITDPANPVKAGNAQDVKNSTLIIGSNYTFRLNGYSKAKAVFLAGDFNDWDDSSLPMTRDGSDWIFSVHLSPGKHKYKFRVDDQWITDPANKLWEQNEYGTGNSVMWIAH